MIDAVVLAGGLNNGPLSSCSQAKNEALIEINKRYMVEYVINALLETPSINNIYIMGLENVTASNFPGDRTFCLPGESSVIKNVISGVNKCKTEQVLITASDIPLLTPMAVEDFISACNREKGDFYYPIVKKATIQSKFTNMKRTYVKTREGIFTGGNIFLVRPEVIPPVAPKVQEFINNRKSPLKLSSILGIKFILLLLLHRLTISVVEKKVSQLFGVRAKAVIVDYPEIGIDVDKPSDLEIVSECITKLC